MAGHELLLILFLAVGIAAVVASWGVYLKFYVVIPPNRAIVVYGRGQVPGPEGKGKAAGVRILVGGGVFIPPWSRKYEFLPLNVMDIECTAAGVGAGAGSQGFEITVSGAVKISSEPEQLKIAAENFFGKSEAQIKETVQRMAEGHVRSILGRARRDDLLIEREKLAAEIQVTVQTDLAPLGIELKSMVIGSVRDRAAEAEEAARARQESRMNALEGKVDALASRLSVVEEKFQEIWGQAKEEDRAPEAEQGVPPPPAEPSSGSGTKDATPGNGTH